MVCRRCRDRGACSLQRIDGVAGIGIDDEVKGKKPQGESCERGDDSERKTEREGALSSRANGDVKERWIGDAATGERENGEQARPTETHGRPTVKRKDERDRRPKQ